MLQNLFRVIGAPIIHHDDLKIPISLRQNRIHRRTNELGVIVGGDDDRNS